MAWRDGGFTPPPLKVSITDGKKQVQFDTPSDFLDWLGRNPEFGEWRHVNWSWTAQPLYGQDLETRVTAIENPEPDDY
jgi:hypothetical protein